MSDVFRRYGEEFLDRHGSSTSIAQRRVLERLSACRTEALGGRVERCDVCGHTVVLYNSCRDRHCPKCLAGASAEWLEARHSELLPVPYFHVVFTLFACLRPVALQNKAVVYDLLFRAASQALLQLAADPKRLGAKIGVLAVLHTWGQTLLDHPHVHCIVPGGGLSPDGSRWISSRRRFFLPVRMLSRLFRGKLIDSLREAYAGGALRFHGSLESLRDPAAFDELLRSIYRHESVVYCKPPFGGPDRVLKYLARYTHRVAISNHRLLAIDGGKVTFAYKDYALGSKWRQMTLEAPEFIRRFLLHVLPRHFVRIRYYGLFANAHRHEKLRLCRTLLGAPEPAPLDAEALAEVADGDEVTIARDVTTDGKSFPCPACKTGRLRLLCNLRPFEPFDPSTSPPTRQLRAAT